MKIVYFILSIILFIIGFETNDPISSISFVFSLVLIIKTINVSESEEIEVYIPPIVGKRIEITSLPYNNAFPDKNCYIGSIGEVIESDENGFILKYESGASLVVGDLNKVKYIYLD